MLFGSAIPILPGETDRFLHLGHELEPLRVEYEALNAKYRLNAHSIWLNQGRDGTDLAVNVYDLPPDELQPMRSREWDMASPYDRWWVGFVGDVFGIDLLEGPPFAAPPQVVFSWEV